MESLQLSTHQLTIPVPPSTSVLCIIDFSPIVTWVVYLVQMTPNRVAWQPPSKELSVLGDSNFVFAKCPHTFSTQRDDRTMTECAGERMSKYTDDPSLSLSRIRLQADNFSLAASPTQPEPVGLLHEVRVAILRPR